MNIPSMITLFSLIVTIISISFLCIFLFIESFKRRLKMNIKKNKTSLTTNTNIKSLRFKELFIINAENLNDQFYKCVHGFIYADPTYNLFQHECKLKQKMVHEMCLNCPKFKEKKSIIKPKKGE